MSWRDYLYWWWLLARWGVKNASWKELAWYFLRLLVVTTFAQATFDIATYHLTGEWANYWVKLLFGMGVLISWIWVIEPIIERKDNG